MRPPFTTKEDEEVPFSFISCVKRGKSIFMDCQYVEIIHSFNVYSIVNTTIHQTELMNVDIAQSVSDYVVTYTYMSRFIQAIINLK